MIGRTVSAVALVILLSAVTAEATPRVEIRPFLGMRLGGSISDGSYDNNLLEKLDVAPGSQFGVTINVPVSPQSATGKVTMVELLINFQESDLRFEPASLSAIPDSIRSRFEEDGDRLILGELKVIYVHLGGLYRFGDYSGWLPYMNAGLGGTIFKASDGDLNETRFSFSFGGGVARMFSEHIGSRIQIKGYLTAISSDSEYWCDRFGSCWVITDTNWFFQGEISGGLVFAF